jgi:archaellin
MNFMGLEYKIKSNYKMSNNVCILYTGIPIIKNTRSCIITSNEDNITNLNITITKPAFDNSLDMIVYNITAIKADVGACYTIANNVRVIHPQYIIMNRQLTEESFSFCSKIINEMSNRLSKLTNQIIFLNIEDNNKKNLFTINYLQSKLDKITQKFILETIENPDEPNAKRKKHY